MFSLLFVYSGLPEAIMADINDIDDIANERVFGAAGAAQPGQQQVNPDGWGQAADPYIDAGGFYGLLSPSASAKARALLNSPEPSSFKRNVAESLSRGDGDTATNLIIGFGEAHDAMEKKKKAEAEATKKARLAAQAKEAKENVAKFLEARATMETDNGDEKPKATGTTIQANQGSGEKRKGRNGSSSAKRRKSSEGNEDGGDGDKKPAAKEDQGKDLPANPSKDD
jgi:hypothetical protein